jgi:NAD(P)-dependent dehydrogenase (short-subunit alcohol dehydrogenase family)
VDEDVFLSLRKSAALVQTGPQSLALEDFSKIFRCFAASISIIGDRGLVDEAAATFGSVHILVKNAGSPRDQYPMTSKVLFGKRL